MAVFNNLTELCEKLPTSNISEYYNTVGEYVKSTISQFGNNDQTVQSSCARIKERNFDVWPQRIGADNSKTQYASFNANMPRYINNYHIPNTAQYVNQNKTPSYKASYVRPTNYNLPMRYQHCYNSKNTSLKVNMKKKRKRTIFTTEQIVALEAMFQKKPYINRDERLMLMQRLQVSEKSIKVWFQNRRRLTDKKDKDDESDSPSSEDSELIGDRLTCIESQIHRNTDQYGYVTLDEKVMSDLVKAIDDYLSQDVYHQTRHDDNNTMILKDGKGGDIIMYEPISPVSLSDVLEDFI